MSAQQPNPPEWMFRLLSAFCPQELVEEIEGDLIEDFNAKSKALGRKRASLLLLWSIIRFFRPGILLRNHVTFNPSNFYMLSNFLKTGLRVMARTKAFTAINVSGLTLGITGALLLFLWIAHEFSFENFHKNKNELHIAWNRAKENGQVNCWSTTPRVLAPTLEKNYAAIKNAVSIAQYGSNQLFTVGDKKLLKTTGIYTDPAFLTMLSFPMIKGSPQTAFTNPNSIVITEGFARQLFGNKEAFGEEVTLSEGDYHFQLTVTGILQELPSNTQFNFEYIISYLFLESLGEKDTFWGNNSVTTLVQLQPDAQAESVNQQIRDVVKKHDANGQHIDIFLYPLTKSRLYSGFENGVASGGRIEIVRMLGLLGIFLIVIAAVNFINLSTARGQHRSREVAVRKVTGAARSSLIIQFLTESMMVAMIAGMISVVAAFLLLPSFRELIQQNISFDLSDPLFWSWFIGGLALIGVIAGGYPALYLSSFVPNRILKGRINAGGNRSSLRSALVIFQFGFAVMLIVSAVVVYKQISFLRDRDSGYLRDNLVFMPLTGELHKNFLSFRNELKDRNAIVSVTKTSGPLTQQWSASTMIKWSGKNPEERTDIERIYVDDNVAPTFGITVIQGRDFDLGQFPTDSAGVLINETALRLMGFKNPIGEKIVDNGREWHVIGVVRDFVFTSPFKHVEPIILFGPQSSWAFNYVYLKINSATPLSENLAALKAASQKYNPQYPFEVQFADADYQYKFDSLKSTLRLTMIFTTLAIFIACLGLLGLAIYMTEVRQKEISIRKVLGGTVISITRLLSYSALKPIMISVIVFSPLAWFAMNWWLQSFSYRTSLDIWIFMLAAFALVMLALITISTQTIRAAKSNPVTSLRSE